MSNGRKSSSSLTGEPHAGGLGGAEWYQSLFELHPDAVVSIDRQGYVVGFNQAFTKLTGYQTEDGIRRPFTDWLAVREGDGGLAAFFTAPDGEYPERRVVLICKDGRKVRRNVLPIPVLIDGQVSGLHVVVKGAARKRISAEERERYTRRDPLTHLPDWSRFTRELDMAIGEARRSRSLLAILFIDLDRFKIVNDVLGHQHGDQLLREAAEKLLACVRKGDVVTRISGDKFSLLLRNIQDVQQVHRIAERLLARFQEPFVLDGQELFITPSIGISLYPLAGEDAEELLRYADTAMFRAKEKGGNTYQMFDSSMTLELAERLSLESSLRKAVERGELVIHYQPQMDISTRRLVGMEALLRWKHPEKGWIPPNRFIPVAEETGVILPITEWLLEQVCLQNKAWQEAGLPPVRISVNLSALQFDQGDPAVLVEKIARRTGMELKWLGLEITESVLMKNTPVTVSTLKRLREMGVFISVDDFGTGYSSLGYLKRFPIDCLKIDQSFVRDVMNDPDNAAIVRAIITLAHHMKLRVVAEGVETEDELSYLAENGCDAVQGYLVGMPASAEECLPLLSSQREGTSFMIR